MLGDNIKKIRLSKGIGLNETARRANITGGYLSSIENNKKTNIGTDILKSIADALAVSVSDFYDSENSKKQELQNTPEIELTNKDKKDIEKSLEKTLAQLEKEDGLMLSGNPVDEDDWEFIKNAIKNGLEYAKKVNKEKYTPKKYKK
ncbi:MAG: helix-turn-helix domain-containing protein [Clostridium sp.]